MADQTITINWNGSTISASYKPAPSEGHIQPSVHPGHHVQWEPGDNVTSIEEIFISTANLEVFSKPPTSANGWSGKIAKNAAGEESYCIAVQTSSNGKQIWDPKIRINPDPSEDSI